MHIKEKIKEAIQYEKFLGFLSDIRVQYLSVFVNLGIWISY